MAEDLCAGPSCGSRDGAAVGHPGSQAHTPMEVVTGFRVPLVPQDALVPGGFASVNTRPRSPLNISDRFVSFFIRRADTQKRPVDLL